MNAKDKARAVRARRNIQELLAKPELSFGERTRKLKVRGNYEVATTWMRKKQIYTKSDIIDFYMEELGKDYKAACGSAIILLSPRDKSKHGDLRGSASNPWGHIAYNEKIERKVDPSTGKLEKQRYRFKFRDVVLDKKRHTYYKRKKLEQEKEVTAVGVEHTKAKSVAVKETVKA